MLWEVDHCPSLSVWGAEVPDEDGALYDYYFLFPGCLEISRTNPFHKGKDYILKDRAALKR